MYIYVIMKTMCPPGYHHNGLVETHTLGHNRTSYIYIYIRTTVHHIYIRTSKRYMNERKNVNRKMT